MVRINTDRTIAGVTRAFVSFKRAPKFTRQHQPTNSDNSSAVPDLRAAPVVVHGAVPVQTTVSPWPCTASKVIEQILAGPACTARNITWPPAKFLVADVAQTARVVWFLGMARSRFHAPILA
jgi:hypothetical protein